MGHAPVPSIPDRIVWQPVVTLDGRRPEGWEALARFDGHSPADVFATATVALEVACVAAALDDAGPLIDAGWVAVNASPDTVASGLLADTIRTSDVPAWRVVVEVTEGPHDDVTDLWRPLHELRRAGVRIALDDVGARSSSLTRIVQLHPALLKLDGRVTRCIDSNASMQAAAATACALSHQLNGQCIAEQVETDAEARWLSVVGVDLAQGRLFGAEDTADVWARRVADGWGR